MDTERESALQVDSGIKILCCTVESNPRRRREGAILYQRKYIPTIYCWTDDSKEWTCLPVPELITTAFLRKDWKRISAESSLMSPRRPSRSRDLTEPKLN